MTTLKSKRLQGCKLSHEAIEQTVIIVNLGRSVRTIQSSGDWNLQVIELYETVRFSLQQDLTTA